MKQISNSTQGTQTNKDRIFSIEDRVYTSQKQKSKWWNIHYPKLEGEKTESCNNIMAQLSRQKFDIFIMN